MTIYTIIVLIILVVFAGWQLITLLRRNKVAKMIDEPAFQSGLHHAQVIDVREKKPFDEGHILGARNVPYSTMKAYYMQIRKDLPVYLYDQSTTLSTRAALLLAKHGYSEIYILKRGYQRWEGKTKKYE